jgi:predicted dehydrogenase
MPLNIGLIGCGRAAERNYLPALSRMAEARLVAVADTIRERRELVSSYIPKCMAFSSAEELLQGSRIEAVIIATPPSTHVALTALALRAGIPVLVEKPLAPTMEGIAALEELVASSRGLIMVGFNRRFWEPACRLHQMMSNIHDSDRVSACLVMITNLKAWSPISGPSDALDDLGSHQLDLLRYVFDREIQAISANWTDKDAIQIQARLSGGGIADCLAAHRNAFQESMNIQLAQQQYLIRTDSDRMQPASGRIRFLLDLSDAIRRRLGGEQLSFSDSYRRQLVSFFNCIRTGQTPHPNIADGIAVIRAVEAARRSADSGGKEVLI